MTFVATSEVPRPEHCRRYFALRGCNLARMNSVLDELKVTPETQLWASQAQSTQTTIYAISAEARRVARWFFTEAIDLTSRAQGPVVWALLPRLDTVTRQHETVDVLKYITSQVIQQTPLLHDEKGISLNAARFQRARSVPEWLNLLASKLDGIEHIYIFIDMGIFEDEDETADNTSQAWNSMITELVARQVRTIVKTAFLCQSPREKKKLGESGNMKLLSVSRVMKRPIQGRVRLRHEGLRIPRNPRSQARYADPSQSERR